eukprot:scaffold5966_cov118-Cylindrotheca_fusiformis.AAC.12
MASLTGKNESSCPFATRKGVTTVATQQEYLQAHPDLLHMENEKICLDADLDVSKPLFFWQIYSLWGKKPIVDICEAFYDSIYEKTQTTNEHDDDYDDEFRAVFIKLAPKRHHINTQLAFWVDAMGGGKTYPGGTHRLVYHHKTKAGDLVMNANGAKRWMNHMKVAIRKNNHHFQTDPRILATLVDFLETKMRTYADLHGWEFDKKDFEISSFLPDNVPSNRVLYVIESSRLVLKKRVVVGNPDLPPCHGASSVCFERSYEGPYLCIEESGVSFAAFFSSNLKI